jgi:hypothetical protein
MRLPSSTSNQPAKAPCGKTTTNPSAMLTIEKFLCRVALVLDLFCIHVRAASRPSILFPFPYIKNFCRGTDALP